MIALGNRAWGTTEGNKKANILYNFCKILGNNFLPSHVEKMVMRGTSYSRKGINALGFLYDEYPKHIKKMNLPILFESFADQRIRYYCLYREKYLGIKGIELWYNKDVDYSIDGMTIPDSNKSQLYIKLPNRGESTILDYLVLNESI